MCVCVFYEKWKMIFLFSSRDEQLMKVAFHLFDGKYVNSIIFHVKRKIEEIHLSSQWIIDAYRMMVWCVPLRGQGPQSKQSHLKLSIMTQQLKIITNMFNSGAINVGTIITFITLYLRATLVLHLSLMCHTCLRMGFITKLGLWWGFFWGFFIGMYFSVPKWSITLWVSR